MEVDFSLWSVLGLSAMVMMSTKPDLVYDLGFQLSYAAVIGIGDVGYDEGWDYKILLRWVTNVDVVDGGFGGASLGTLPLCAWVFQTFPLWELLPMSLQVH